MQVKVRGQARGSNQLGRSSDLHPGPELDDLSSLGIENRGIPRAISLQFVGC